MFDFISLGSDNTYADGVNYTGNDSLANLNILDSASKVKAAAAYKAISNAKADVLVAPIYFKGIRNAPDPYQH